MSKNPMLHYLMNIFNGLVLTEFPAVREILSVRRISKYISCAEYPSTISVCEFNMDLASAFQQLKEDQAMKFCHLLM
jgi:hypothetical protein